MRKLRFIFPFLFLSLCFCNCSKDDSSYNVPITTVTYSLTEGKVIRSALYTSDYKDTTWIANWECISNDTLFSDTLPLPAYLNNRYSSIQNDAALIYTINSDSVVLMGGLEGINPEGNFYTDPNGVKVKYKYINNNLMALQDTSRSNWFQIGKKIGDELKIRMLYISLWDGEANSAGVQNKTWNISYLDTFDNDSIKRFNLPSINTILKNKGFTNVIDSLNLYSTYDNRQMFWYIDEYTFKIKAEPLPSDSI